MTTVNVVPRKARAEGVNTFILEHFTAAALTAAADKKKWIVPYDSRLVDVIVSSDTIGSGGTSTIIDVNKDGTTIYTTQANRPTLLLADTGMYAEAAEPEITKFLAGDIISYDVDQVTSTGPALTMVALVFEAF